MVQLIPQLFAQVVARRTPALKILKCTPRFGVVVGCFSHELFRAFYSSATIAPGMSPRPGRSCSKITVAAALNFDAAFSATASPEPTGRTQLIPALGLDPNTDPGLAGETGL